MTSAPLWPRAFPDPVRHVMSSEPPPPALSGPEITQLLREWGGGSDSAAERLLPVIYAELHRQAARAMRREPVEHTLQATALVHEAYVRLVDQHNMQWRNRAQFFGIAAQLMRRILIDHARARHAAKRGGGNARLTLTDAHAAAPEEAENVDVLALNDALEGLAALDARQARLVEMRYFGGLTIEETAEALDISPATVKREWATARAWLKRELTAR